MKYTMLVIGSLCCGIFLSAAPPAGNGFTVTGYIKGLKAPYVYLEWAVGDSMHKDSAAVRDSRFRFGGKVDQPVLAYFLTKKGYTLALSLWNINRLILDRKSVV